MISNIMKTLLEAEEEEEKVVEKSKKICEKCGNEITSRLFGIKKICPECRQKDKLKQQESDKLNEKDECPACIENGYDNINYICPGRDNFHIPKSRQCWVVPSWE